MIRRLTPDEQAAWCAWWHYGANGYIKAEMDRRLFWRLVARAQARARTAQAAIAAVLLAVLLAGCGPLPDKLDAGADLYGAGESDGGCENDGGADAGPSVWAECCACLDGLGCLEVPQGVCRQGLEHDHAGCGLIECLDVCERA